MKMIVAVVQPEKLEDVKEALFHAEVCKMTVSRVKGWWETGRFHRALPRTGPLSEPA